MTREEAVQVVTMVGSRYPLWWDKVGELTLNEWAGEFTPFGPQKEILILLRIKLRSWDSVFPPPLATFRTWLVEHRQKQRDKMQRLPEPRPDPAKILADRTRWRRLIHTVCGSLGRV